MIDVLNTYLPNVVMLYPEFKQAIIDTVIMVIWSGIISFVIGLSLGVLVTVVKEDGLLEQLVVFHLLDKLINFFRSIPFIILLTFVIPLTRAIMGTAIGIEGAIIPLILGVTPFFVRQIENVLTEVDSGLIEAAQSMGLSPLAIIFKIYLRESISGIIRASTITLISLLSFTAMAGVVGAGGLGDFAIRYGHDRNLLDVTWVTVLTVFIMVSIIQLIGSYLAKKYQH